MSDNNGQSNNDFFTLLMYVITKPVGFILPVILLLVAPLYLKDLFSGLGLLLVCAFYLVFITSWTKKRLQATGQYDVLMQGLKAKKASK